MSEATLTPPLLEEFRRWIASAYPQEAERLLWALEHTTPALSIRCNRSKQELYDFSLNHLPLERAVAWCREGYYLAERPFFAHDPLWHAGAYYVQEAGSMALAQLQSLWGEEPMDVLDLSAAPGGKSTLLTQILPKGSRLIANEPIPKRAQILSENLTKWGYPEVIVTQSYPDQLRKAGLVFDLIVVDAPCSGEGLFRKSPEARDEWSLEAVEECALRQRDILREAWQMLRPNGWLVYATCTFNPRENEENVRFLIEELGATYTPLVDVPEEWNWVEGKEGLGYHFLPGITDSEGFYWALLRKAGSDEVVEGKSSVKRARKGERKAQPLSLSKEITQWVKASYRDYTPVAMGEEIVLLSSELLEHYKALQASGIVMLSAGIPCATQKGNKLRPSSLLPFSQAIETEAFPRVELSLREALRYLAGEAIQLPATAPQGYCLLLFEGVPVAVAHNLGHRANNLYPKPYRLKSLPK
ncbi:methyltransferase RsmF C-terminal domain-like protein [Porphyromonas circumdentaria]|uniref:16S rRNA C967 or C1407 C5-methylase, RsmB/RsmF family n=1 Tax=Porphyromonas circumdentaria TaxID=29524 RepID=A0A1T4LS90_9PORP|nr:hypothetical protein [Porphyromonas circumdentaria]MBB6275463.1 16S rRNA C967 or C1407 C5-methylase (RsmB/RsmF family)/NOL1/NOP2/fmu family ribosome biogenesis protein [Porphyromonas circumdentaria]SJZ57388.1 16S rRNA C967 or C1407 C5-methylase, RsmB/RsmF family [Porphyromonas circumdentaria]